MDKPTKTGRPRGRPRKAPPAAENYSEASNLPSHEEWECSQKTEAEVVLAEEDFPDEAFSEDLNITPEGFEKDLKQPLMKRMKIGNAKNFTVAMLVVNGIPQVMIASVMGISLDKLRSKFRFELDHGKAAVNANVAGMLYKRCMEGNVPAIKFYLETQADYKTADKRDPKEGHKDNLTEIERRQIMANMLMEDPRMLAVLKQKMKDVKTESPSTKQLN